MMYRRLVFSSRISRYSKSGWTAKRRFEARVQGVVV
jgi:hypothetical protein